MQVGKHDIYQVISFVKLRSLHSMPNISQVVTSIRLRVNCIFMKDGDVEL